MREYMLDITESLRHGINPSPYESRNSMALRDIFGLVPSDNGLRCPFASENVYEYKEKYNYLSPIWIEGHLEEHWVQQPQGWTIGYDMLSVDHSNAGNLGATGAIQTRETFHLKSGQYTLQWEDMKANNLYIFYSIYVLHGGEWMHKVWDSINTQYDWNWYGRSAEFTIPEDGEYSVFISWSSYSIGPTDEKLINIRRMSLVESVSATPFRTGYRSQMLFGKDITLFMGVVEDGNSYRVSPMTMNLPSYHVEPFYFYDRNGETSDFSYDGNYFDFVEFDNAWFVNCSSSFGMKIPLLSNPLLLKDFWANSICSWENRIVLGGLNGNVLSSETFTSVFGEAVSLAPLDSVLREDVAPGRDTLFWSSVRGGSITRSFEAEVSLLGVPLTPDKAMVAELFNMVRSGECGFWRIPDSDEIVCVRQLGADLLVMGNRSVWLVKLRKGEEGMKAEGVRVLGIGMKGFRSVSGNESKLIGADITGRAWEFVVGSPPVMIDYQAIFVRVRYAVYDEVTDTHYLTDGEKEGWLLTKEGMSHDRRMVLGLRWYFGKLLVLETDPVTVPPEWDFEVYTGFDYRFATDIIDFGNRQIKTIRSIEVYGSNADRWEAFIFVRGDTSGPWMDSGWLTGNDQGVIMNSVSGVEFKFVVRGVCAERRHDVQINSCIIRWQQSDKRYIRGSYATEIGNRQY